LSSPVPRLALALTVAFGASPAPSQRTGYRINHGGRRS